MRPSTSTTARITQAYRAQYPDPIAFRAGEAVTIGEKEDRWQDNDQWVWVWCTDARGKSGWVPQNYVERLPDGHGRGLRDYDAHELAAEAGETVTILDEASGWYWCRNASGQFGWLPITNVERDQG